MRVIFWVRVCFGEGLGFFLGFFESGYFEGLGFKILSESVIEIEIEINVESEIEVECEVESESEIG